MRPLTEDETKIFFEKLAKYIGRNIKVLIDRKDEEYCFRIQKDRVYYVSVRIMNWAQTVSRGNLACLGVCFGKFTKTQKFRLQVTCLDIIAPYAKYKIWVKSSSEMSFLYGNHILKAGLAKITENTPEHQGVIVFSMSDIPLGFGTTARSTLDCRKVDPTAIVCYHQADIGEYLRDEEHLV
eukprot:TRINITY_DN2152_c0_g2_i2.p1 TRINITY_DN2152_c0_g2~~TRINITY_DN2152_c0_g2_i2.p1  ORF type:complete len:181 (-),score=15.42 TRINITY_DN2152_c0_g2_i2:40-582(-)